MLLKIKATVANTCRRYSWVKPIVRYQGAKHLTSIFREKILRPGFAKAMRLRGKPGTAPPRPVVGKALWPTIVPVKWYWTLRDEADSSGVFEMRKYHHLGIPTTEKREGEVHLKHLKIYVSSYKESLYHIEWMRYEPDAPYPELVKTMPLVAFEVDDLEQELKGKKVIIEPNSPSPGVTVAFIEDHGAPVEFLQIDKTRAKHA